MDNNTITIEDAKLIFRNFEGKEGRYNGKGERGFAIVLSSEQAVALAKDGWNVKYLKAGEEEGDEQTPYLPIAVNYKNRPPRITLISSGGRTVLNENTVEVLDYADIALADLTLRPYYWEVNDKSGLKAYLKSLFVTLEEDDLDRKYAVRDGEE